MIQSSQPSSLKFTYRAFLLHLYLDFFPCLFPCRLLCAVLLRRRGPSPVPPFIGFSSTDLRDLIFSFISLNRFSLFLERSWMWRGPSVCGAPDALLNILNSAPTSSSFSERVETSNRYFCLLKGECKRLSFPSVTPAEPDSISRLKHCASFLLTFSVWFALSFFFYKRSNKSNTTLPNN
uniref:Uncharacterized protein n=1 Tax=Cyprinodon variegatus TaxID=28743 RepID=A0A3Q2DXL4_CYPVA